MIFAMALDELADLILRHAGGSGSSAIPGTLLLRADAPTSNVSVVAEPMLCLVAQGAKSIVSGQRVVEFGPSHSLSVSMAMPVSSSILRASKAQPYLAVGFPVDQMLLAELAATVPASASDASDGTLDLKPLQNDLLEAALRVLRFLDRPEDLAVLGPMAARELHYRLVTGAHARTFRELVQGGAIGAKIARAAAWIRQHYDEQLRIAHLAEIASLSEGAFHRAFKARTGMSPLEYQKGIRLHEARSRLLADTDDVAAVGFAVGYNSPSQFSREYARQFGHPPARDAAMLRSAGVSSETTW